MYISNSSNIGMATLLQNNKNCMKTLTNGGATAGGNHIIVGNVVTTSTGNSTHSNQVGAIVSSGPNVATTTSVAGGNVGGGAGGNAVTTLGGNLVLPAQPQTILLTNGATGTSTIITYQQYQQLLQQQQQQQQQRVLVSQNLVNLPIHNLVSTGNGGLAVITDANHQATTSSSTTTHQGAFLVATSSASSGVSQFQQQLQQHLNANANGVGNTGSTVVTTSTYLQPTHQQQRLITTTSGGGQTATTRHFSQFSRQHQQQPAVVSIASTPLNSVNNQQSQQRTTVLINRNNNTIIAGNATQRLQHATILTTTGTKTPATLIKKQGSTNASASQPILVNSAAVQQVLNAGKGQIINVVKSNAGVTNNNNTKHFITKTETITANLPQQQRFSSANIQQLRPQQQQQLKIFTTQNIPQRATILNNISSSSTTPATILNSNLTKNHFINKTQITAASLSAARAAVAASSSASLKPTAINATTTPSAPTSSSAASTLSFTQQQQTIPQHHHQINGHLINNFNKNPNTLNTTNLQQPASKLVPNGHIIHTTANNHNINNSNNHHHTTSTATTSSSFTTTATNSHNLSSFATPFSSLSSANTSNTTTTTSYTASAANATHNASTAAVGGHGTSSTESASNSEINNSTTAVAAAAAAAAATEQEAEPEIDIVINNVVCSFSVRCHLNLREIALNGANVEYRRENGMVTMKLRRPYTTASIWSSGRITCTGATSEEQARIAARRYARILGNLGFRVRFHNFRVVNVLGTCSMPWAIKIVNFSEKFREEASYEPELHPGVTYKLRYPKATLKIFSTGSITVTAASVAHVQAAIEHIFPLVYEFRKKRSPEELEQLRLKQQQNATFEDITEETVADASAAKLAAAGGDISAITKPLRRGISNTFTKFPNAKRKCTKIDGGVDVDDFVDADDPDNVIMGSTGGGDIGDDDDIVLFDPNESIIAGPDDDEDDL